MLLTLPLRYIAVAQKLLLTGNHQEAFEEPERQRLLATLADDNVVDVRIGLSRFISLACGKIVFKVSGCLDTIANIFLHSSLFP